MDITRMASYLWKLQPQLTCERLSAMLLERLISTADQRAQKLAVADPVRQLNYGQLTVFARIMRDLIVKHSRCERIGILLPGSTAFVGTLYGCMWAGRIAVPLNFMLQPPELSKIIRDAGLDVVLTIGHFQKLTAAWNVNCVLLDEINFRRRFLVSKLKRSPAVPEAAENQTAVILYTSGTSAEPKGVELTYGNLASNCRDSIAHARIQTDHTLLSVLPPFHVFGLTALTILPLWEGMTVHYIPRFSPVKTVKTIEQQRISIFMAIPSMYAAMLRVKHVSRESLKSLYLAISGGEALQGSTATAFIEEFGLQIYEGYGLTETSPVVSINLPWSYESGSVGKAIPHCQVRIADAQGRPLGPAEDGEIRLKGPGVMKGYFQKPQESARVFDADGWFQTGDQGRLSPEGYLRITGRIKDMMIIGGENVFPAEIEQVLVQHEAVAEAAVIGIPDATRGEVAEAFVIPIENAQVSDDELRRLCRDRLAGFKVPRRIHICHDLPRGPTGKILKRALRS